VQELADTVIAVARCLRLCGEGNVHVDNAESFSFISLPSTAILSLWL